MANTHFQSIAGGVKATATFAAQQYQAWQQRSQARASSQGSIYDIPLEISSKTFYDTFTGFMIQAIGLLAPLAIALVLSISNGYFFSGFHFLDGDPLTALSYVAGFTLEFIGLGMVYKASRQLRKKEYRGMLLTVSILLILMAGSIFAQYMFLQVLYINGTLHVPDNAAERVPFFSLLIGVASMRGHDIVFFIRAVLLHIGELSCCFIIVDRNKTATQLIADRREVHEAHLAIERSELQLQRERDEAEQDRQIKLIQHQWLMERIGKTVDGTVSPILPQTVVHPVEPTDPLQHPRLDTTQASQSGHNGNGQK